MKAESGQEHIVHRKLPANFSADDQALFAHELKKVIPATHILKLDHATILDDLIYKNFRFYTDYCLPYPMTWREQLKRLKFLLKTGLRYDRCIWITDSWSQGYFHWMTDALPRLLSCKEIATTKIVVLPDIYRQEEYIQSSLNILGYRPVYYSGRCDIEELWIPFYTAPSGNYNVSLLRALKKQLQPSGVSEKPFRKIYISRANARSRIIENEAELILLLKTMGVEIHYFEEYSLQKQMELMAETSLLVGLHGAGLTNMLFMPEHTAVLEFRNSGDCQGNCYFSMADALNLDYYYLLCKGSEHPAYKMVFTVDIELVKKTLSLFL